MLLFSTFLASLYIESASAQVISTTGRCGAAFGFTCTGSALGQCCSAAGWCGTSSEYCGANCQPKFGTCGVASSSSAVPVPSIKAVSTDSRCGSKYNYQLCTGSPWGDCCSVFGYCGSTSDFCSFSRCQKDYGICTDSPATLSSIIIGGGGSCVSSSLTCPAVESILSTTTRTITSIASAPPPVTRTLNLTKTLSLTETETVTEMATPLLDLVQPTGQPKLATVTSLEKVTIMETSILTKQAQTVTEATTVEVLSVNSVTVTSVSISISTLTSIKPAQTITTTASPLLDLGLAASLGVGIPPATTVTITSTATGSVLCPSGIPVANGGFESSPISPWLALSAGTGTFGRATGGANLSLSSYRVGIDATNPNLPQRVIQPVLLCPGSTYSLAFQMRRLTTVGTISISGGIQLGSGAYVSMAGGTVASFLFTAAPNIATLSIPAGSGLVTGVLMLEVTFTGALGAKEVYIDDVILTKTA